MTLRFEQIYKEMPFGNLTRLVKNVNWTQTPQPRAAAK